MTGRGKEAAEIADDLERLGHELRTDFDTAVRTIAPVTFSGPVAQLFDRRLRAHLGELNAILATMGVATDDLRITGRSDGELGLRRPSTGHHRDPGTHAPETVPVPAALPAQYRRLLPLVQESAARHHVSPALLLAIMDRETGDPHGIGYGGRNPAATNGDDFGLMQINRSAHPDFFAHHDWRDPAANIDYGATVIAGDLRHYDGDVGRAAAAYNAGPGAVDRALAAGRGADSVTTGGDYGSDVARRYEHFRRVLERH
jgi:hypothetical protein